MLPRSCFSASAFETYSVRSTWGILLIRFCTASACFLVAFCFMKTRRVSSARTFWFVVELALITGTNTPIKSVVSTTVTIAARLGAALRRSARNASAMKKNKWVTTTSYELGSPFVWPSSPTPISALTRTANSLVDSSW